VRRAMAIQLINKELGLAKNENQFKVLLSSKN
jgi:hypothetical protein